ncbi:MAG: AMP-binding protein [Polyangiaceae bacterium]
MSVQASPLLTRFFAAANPNNHAPAIVDEAESVDFRSLGERVRRVAAGLAAQGLAGPRAGTDAASVDPPRVAMLVAQGSGWVEAFFGITLAGAIAVPLSHLHPPLEQQWFVETSRAQAVIVSSDMRAELEGRAEPLGDVPLLDIETLRTSAGLFPTDSFPAGDQPAVILYTSGTTGKPKGALITHANLGELARLVAEAWEWRPSDSLLHCLPLHHLHGLGIALFVSLLSGSRTQMLQRFDAPRMWEAMKDANVLMGVPTMHKKLLDALDAAPAADQARWREHARGLRLITSGSAALPTTVGSRWQELCGSYPLERFGMTEIGVGMTNPVAGPRKPGSCGKVLPGMQIRIVDEAGVDVSPGQSGEIWIKGPSVFAGYDGNPEATAASFVDGWFKSGDTATWDEEGYCRILGRTSVDILKSGGYKLSALEIEEVFREHPAVADVAVVGIADETWGEIAVASILARPGHEADIDEASLREWAKQHIAAYKVPKRILRFDEFPRNPVGKVLKPALKELVSARL